MAAVPISAYGTILGFPILQKEPAGF